MDKILQAHVSSIPSLYSHSNSNSTKPFSSTHTSGPGKQRFSSKPRFSNSKNYNKAPSNTFSFWVQCQICGKYGHTALHCWHRFDSSTPSQITANTTHFSSSLSDDEPSILGPQLLFMILFGTLIVVRLITLLLTTLIFPQKHHTHVRKKLL